MNYISNLAELSQIRLGIVFGNELSDSNRHSERIARERRCQRTRGLRMTGLKRDFVRENVFVTSGAKIHQDKLASKIFHRSNESSFAR